MEVFEMRCDELVPTKSKVERQLNLDTDNKT